MFCRYAYNYILALSETLNILETSDNKSVDDQHTSTSVHEQQVANLASAPQQYIGSTYGTASAAAYKQEPAWQYNSVPSCIQYSPSPASNTDSYDYYSEVSCSPQSNLSSNEWNQAIEEDIMSASSPIFTNQQHQYYAYHNNTSSAQNMLHMPEISNALSHCH